MLKHDNSDAIQTEIRPVTQHRKKPIEVALPLEAINKARIRSATVLVGWHRND